MEQVALFALDSSSSAVSAEACAAPIGRPQRRRRRARSLGRSHRPSTIAMLAALRDDFATITASLRRLERGAALDLDPSGEPRAIDDSESPSALRQR